MALLDKMEQRLRDVMPMVTTGRFIGFEVSYKYVRAWRNSAYGNNLHSSQIQNVWLNK